MLRARIGVQLLSIGSMARDDPKEWVYYERTTQHSEDDCNICLLPRLTPYRGIPVDGGKVGGIPLQIIDGLTRFLTTIIEDVAEKDITFVNIQRKPEKLLKLVESTSLKLLIIRHLKD